MFIYLFLSRRSFGGCLVRMTGINFKCFLIFVVYALTLGHFLCLCCFGFRRHIGTDFKPLPVRESEVSHLLLLWFYLGFLMSSKLQIYQCQMTNPAALLKVSSFLVQYLVKGTFGWGEVSACAFISVNCNCFSNTGMAQLGLGLE